MKKSSSNVLIKNLIEFGLGEKEAKAYLVLLELEIATVSEIAEAADVNRSSAYVVLESLKKKGLVSISEDKSVQRYTAISPDMLLFEAQAKARQAEDIKKNIHEIVPELKALHKDTKQKPKIRVFEGNQGILSALEDSLGSKEKLIRACSSHQEWLSTHADFDAYFREYGKKRAKLKIKMRGIHPDTEITKKIVSENPAFDKPILIPKDKYTFPAEITIYDNKINYMSPDKKGFAIMIESKEMADVMKDIFDLAYKEAERLHKIGGLVHTYKTSLTQYTKKAP